MFEKIFLKKIEQKLKTEKKTIEGELKKFTQKDKKLEDNWDTKFPKFNGGEAGSAALEKAADEVEEYTTLLSIEYSLEKRLRDINLALEKIKKGEYGICERCKKNIDKERLEAYPEARFCLKCEKK